MKHSHDAVGNQVAAASSCSVSIRILTPPIRDKTSIGDLLTHMNEDGAKARLKAQLGLSCNECRA
jgi:hypothetical protein